MPDYGRVTVGPLEWTEHPVLRVPTLEEVRALAERAVLKEFWEKREERIRLEGKDPLRYGFEPEWWGKVDAEMAELRALYPKGVVTEVDLGGNRAAKTQRASKLVVQVMVDRPGAKVWACQSTEAISVQTQQPYVFNHLPAEWRPDATGKRRSGRVTKIVYSQAGGFTESTFVLPNGSQCWFKYYSQDVKTLEGPELDYCWCDELVTPEWIDTVKYRLFNRNGTLHVTFTPVRGYSPTVQKFLAAAETVERSDAELLPLYDEERNLTGYEQVPRVQLNRPEKAKIFYFHNKDNPWGNYEGLVSDLKGKSRQVILTRAYGVPVKAMANRFPGFNSGSSPRVHVVTRGMIPTVGTRYLFIDPCGGRTWFMTWVLVDPFKRHFIYREWPCPTIYIEGVGYPEEWARPDGSRADGAPGAAQECASHFGLVRYKEEILRMESEQSLALDKAGQPVPEVVFERYMDSRYAHSRRQGRDEVVTLLEEMRDLELDFSPTPGDEIDEGVAMINSMLDYPDPAAPVGPGNEPRLFVCEECENTIYALQNWTGKDGKKGACKDPVDNVRYMALSDLEDVGEGATALESYGGYER